MELICDVIIRDKKTGIVVNEARNISSGRFSHDADGRAIYRFNFDFSTAVDKRIVDEIDMMETENDSL